jgi:hypothetical protein
MKEVFMIIFKPATDPDDWKADDSSRDLSEMSTSKNNVYLRLVQYHGSFESHLLKLFYFRDFDIYFDEWSNTVYKAAFDVPKIKKAHGKDQFPSTEQIVEWMWNETADVFDNTHASFVRAVNNKGNRAYQQLPYIHQGGDEQQAANFIKAYIFWLAKRLSKEGRVSLDDVRDEIKLLFKKYPV